MSLHPPEVYMCGWPADGHCPSQDPYRREPPFEKCRQPSTRYAASPPGIVVWSMGVCSEHVPAADASGCSIVPLDYVGAFDDYVDEAEIDRQLVDMVHGPRSLPVVSRPLRGLFPVLGIGMAVGATAVYGAYAAARDLTRWLVDP